MIELNQANPLAEVMASDAYEAGFKIGLSGRLGLNPYADETDEHEFWKLGCAAGYVAAC